METTSGRSSRIALAHYPAIIKVLTELFDTEVKDASSATPPEELQAEAPAKKRDKPRTVYLEKESPSPEEKPVKRKHHGRCHRQQCVGAENAKPRLQDDQNADEADADRSPAAPTDIFAQNEA